MLSFDPDPQSLARGFGPASLDGQGTFALDYNNPRGRRRLVFDLSLSLRGVRAGPTGGALSTAILIRNVHFEIRPELRYSLVGADTWSSWRAALGGRVRLPIYSEMLDRPLIRSSPFKTMRLALLPIELDLPTPTGPRPPRAPFRSQIGLHDDLPGTACILGSDLLNYGLLAWEDGCTYFFRFDGDKPPEIHDRVRPVSPTPI